MKSFELKVEFVVTDKGYEQIGKELESVQNRARPSNPDDPQDLEGLKVLVGLLGQPYVEVSNVDVDEVTK